MVNVLYEAQIGCEIPCGTGKGASMKRNIKTIVYIGCIVSQSLCFLVIVKTTVYISYIVSRSLCFLIIIKMTVYISYIIS